MHPQSTAPPPPRVSHANSAQLWVPHVRIFGHGIARTLTCPVPGAPLQLRLLLLGWDTTSLNLPQLLCTRPTVYSTQPMIRILGTTFAGLLGLAFGSFLNVCLTRWPEDESIVHPRSHCRSCDHTLAWWENIPLFSWLFLRGRCRNCRTWIGIRYPLVELAVGVLWAVAVWRFPANLFDPDLPRFIVFQSWISTIGLMVFDWLLIALAVLDAENLWLPNFLTLPGTAVGFIASVFSPNVALGLASIVPSPSHPGIQAVWGEQGRTAIFRLIAIFVAAGIILLTRWLYKLIRHREGVGLGDAKLMALLAAWLGLPLTLLTFVISTFLGAIASLILLAIPSARTNEESWATTKLPFGTFLCIGGIISSLWGQPIVDAYLRLAGY